MLFNTKDSSTLIGAIAQSRQAKIDAGAYQRVINDIRLKGTDTDWFAQQLDISQYSHMSDEVKSTLVDIQEELRKTGGDGEKAIEQIEVALDETSAKGTKLGNTIKNVGVSIVNGLASAGISLAISAIISGIVTIADKLFITKKEAEEFTQTFRDGFSTMKTEQSKTISDLQGLEQEFEQLSKGVNALGQNVSLSDEEFERYHEITSSIAEMMPNLVQGYDEQGNAIIRLTDNVKSLSAAYKEARQEQAYNLYNQEDEKGQKVIKGVYENARNTVEGKHGATLQDTLDVYKQLAKMDAKTFIDAAKNTEDYFGVGTNAFLAQDLMTEAGVTNLDSLSDDDFKKAHAMLISQYKDYQNEIKMATKDVREAGLTYAQGLEDFWDNLNERQIKAFENYVNTFDYDFLKENDLFEEENMKTYMTNLIDVFGNLSDKNIEQIDLKLNLSTQFNNGEISAAEYYQKLQELNEYLNQIQDGDIKKIVSVLFNLSVKDENKIDDRLNYLKMIMGDNWDDKYLEDITEKELDLVMNIEPRYQMSNNFDDRGFQQYEYGYDEKGVKVKLEPEIDPYDWEEVQGQISDQINPIKLEPDADDLVADLKGLESDWSSLHTVYETGTSGETISASNIQGVTDAFGGIGADDEGKFNALSSALEKYNKELVENPGNVDKVQSASDELATAYLDISGSLEDLIDKDAEYAKQVLKQQGIENAEEVVQSRLSKTYKATRQNLANLAKTVAQYSEELKKSDKTAADFNPMNGQFKDITSDVANLLGEYNQETGELVAPANIDGQFMADNWELVEDAITGVDGALDQLYNKLALANAKKVLIEAGLDDTQVKDELNNISTMLDIASGWTMEPQALLDNSEFMTALQACYDGTEASVNAINAALGTIGMKIQYKTTPRKITVPASQATASNSKATNTYENGRSTVKYWTTEQLTVDDFEIVSTSTGKGTGGTGVNLGSNSNTGTGGGDGGGGGNNNDKASKDKNKAQKNAAETFDWIEVYIKRIEEEIARLDKDATNVYKKWEDRNTSLAKEMAKVTEQIKAQKQAAEEYSRNANLVTGSGQLLTEKQNTAVKKAQKAWTNKLQQKIIDGDYTLTEKKKNGKTKTKLNTKKLEKDLGNAYNTYIKDAAQELFSLVKKNNKKNKKTKVQKNIIVGDNNKPKKSDYGDNTAQYKADLKDWKKAQEIWATGKYQEKILNGQITGEDIEQISNKYLVDAIKNTSEWVQKSIDENDEIQDLKIKLADLNKEELDNILKKWEQIIDVTQREVDDIDDMISRVETMGYWVSTDWLEKQNEKSATMVFKYDADLEEAKNKLNEWVRKQEDEGKLYKDSEYYKEAVANLDDLTNKRNQELNKIEERNKKAREIIKEQFDYIEERLDGITKEAEALIEMASIEKTMDEYGNFNDRGMLKLAMVGAKFEEAERKLEDYTKRRQELEEQLLHDPMNKDLLAEVDEVRQGEYDMWKELASSYDEVASIFKESIDAHLNKLKEIIDDYKSALSAAKDLYEFQKNIGNQTKNIENLRKQLVAYQGDDSEAGRKRRQELTNQLNSAEQQLQETEWDRYINQTGEILDNLYNDYEETLNARLDNVEFLMGELITEVNNNAKSVVNGLTETMNTYGLQPSYFKDLLTKDKENAASVTENADANQKKILSGLHKDLYGDDSTLGKVTTSLKDYVKSMETAMDDDKLFTKVFGKFKQLKVAEDGTLEVVDVTKDKVKVAKPIDNDRPLVHMYDIDEPNINNNKTNTTTAAQEAEQKKKAQEVENLQRQYDDYKAKITQEERKLNDERTKKKPNQEKINQYQKTINEYDALLRQIERELEKYGISTAVANKTFNNLNTNLLNGFAKGSKGISSTQLAWTNENWEKEGGELIFRKSDGAVLTPLNQGDMVFTADMTQRLWEIAQGMVPTSVGGQKLPNISSNNHSTVNTNNQITISLPNVNDYDSFKRELQNDSRFEKFIQEVTIGQAMGNNTLNKRKY